MMNEKNFNVEYKLGLVENLKGIVDKEKDELDTLEKTVERTSGALDKLRDLITNEVNQKVEMYSEQLSEHRSRMVMLEQEYKSLSKEFKDLLSIADRMGINVPDDLKNIGFEDNSSNTDNKFEKSDDDEAKPETIDTDASEDENKDEDKGEVRSLGASLKGDNSIAEPASPAQPPVL